MSAFQVLAGEEQPTRSQRLVATFTLVERKKNW
jgi:hypothetical protein